MELPEGQPTIERLPRMRGIPGTCIGSAAAPRMTNFPLTPSPPNTALIASPFVTVAMMTLAPPNFSNSAEESCVLLSM